MPQSCYIAVHGHSAPAPSIPIAPEGYRRQGAPEPQTCGLLRRAPRGSGSWLNLG